MKVLLLDADGVILNKGEYFSERFAREYNLPLEDVVEFFKGPFLLCQKGEADLKEELEPYLKKWDWDKGVDAFLKYWFDSDLVFNEGIQSTLSRFREKGIKCYLASNNEKYRAKEICRMLDEVGLLDGAYFSADLKVRKEDSKFFEYVLTNIGVEAKDAYFVDNDQKNVDAALHLGVNASLYNEHVLDDLLAKIN